MNAVEFESWARGWSEPLTYLAFFGCLAAFAGLEVLLARGARPALRRRRWPANFGLTAINIVVLGALPVTGLMAADFARGHGIGLMTAIDPPSWAAIPGGILLRSLIGYGVHVAMHKIALLWRFHRVHHGDPAFDVSTTVRFHPLEFVITLPIVLTAIVALGIPPLAILIYEVIDAAMAVWTHANIRLAPRLARIVELVLVTPDMHRLHHSTRQAETDSNYGAIVSWWDRLFGTHRRAAPAYLADMELGLDGDRDGRETRLGGLLLNPFGR